MAATKVPPSFTTGESRAGDHSSVEGEILSRLSHTHVFYPKKNKIILDDIEVSIRGIKYSASIFPSKHGREGRGYFLALKPQHAGPDF